MNEQEIRALLLSRDERGMQELLRHYGPLMRYIIAPILPNAQDREDCLMETAMRVWEKIESFDAQRGSWNAWLTAIARNTARNYRRNIHLHSSTAEIPAKTPSQEMPPEDALIRREREEALVRALERLTAKERTIFYRKYYYLQPTAQIASEMGLTERAVEGQLYRLKRKLRTMLGGEGYDRP